MWCNVKVQVSPGIEYIFKLIILEYIVDSRQRLQ